MTMSVSLKLPAWGKLLVLLLALGVPGVGSPTVAKSSWSIVTQPSRPVNGSPLLLRVNTPQSVEQLSAKWLGHNVALKFDPISKSWYGIAGVSLETKPGNYALQLNAIGKNGEPISFERNIKTGKAKYRRISVTVSKKFTEPSPEQLKTISQDK